MPRYVAFLRAINVGGHTVKMDRLRAIFADLGFTNVETFIASGNVIFDATARDTVRLERRIEQGLAEALGYDVGVYVRTPAELAAIVAYAPFGTPDPTTLGQGVWVAFLKHPLDADAERALAELRTPDDDFHAHGREAYWLCRLARFSDSTVKPKPLARALGETTMRNVTTVRKLAARYPA